LDEEKIYKRCSKLMEASDFQINAHKLSQKFNRSPLFSDISFSLQTGDSLAVTGSNGSGKSTLLMIAACLISPTRGSMVYKKDGREVPKGAVSEYMGFTSPLVNPYEELTGYENIAFMQKGKIKHEFAESMLLDFKLKKHAHRQVRFYSTGMKQRLKLILALLNDSPVMFFDEPGSNLDSEGKDMAYSYIQGIMGDKIVVIATNEKTETALCKRDICLD